MCSSHLSIASELDGNAPVGDAFSASGAYERRAHHKMSACDENALLPRLTCRGTRAAAARPPREGPAWMAAAAQASRLPPPPVVVARPYAHVHAL
eukprot:4826387-Pleurochrysis_carterae.AAC.5